MRKLLLVLAAGLSGCAGRENLRDWSEVLTIRGSVGLGARASVRIGGFMHPGLGGDASLEAGLHHGPYMGVHGGLDLLFYHVEQCQDGAKAPTGERDCECAGLIVPAITRAGTYPALHMADLEVSVFAGVLGLGLGISLGELLDAIVNLFGVDLDPQREDYEPFESREKSP